MKKPWEKPKLIVLARGKPEEAVLLFCKRLIGEWEGENGLWNIACTTETGEWVPCSPWTWS